jgi:hypothetical protein
LEGQLNKGKLDIAE